MAGKGRSRPPKAEQAPAARATPQPHTTAAGYLQDHTALGLAAWAYRPGMPTELHAPGADLKAAAVDRKQGPAPSFAPGLARFNQAMNRYSDPDDNSNDPSTLPTGKWNAAAAPQGTQGLGNPPSLATPTPPMGVPFTQGAAPLSPPQSNRAQTRGRIREAIAMQRAYEDDNGTPSQRATFNLQRRQARQADRTSAPAMSPKQSRAFNQANQHFEASHMQTQTQTPDSGNANHNRGTQNINNLKAIIANKQARAMQRSDDDGAD